MPSSPWPSSPSLSPSSPSPSPAPSPVAITFSDNGQAAAAFPAAPTPSKTSVPNLEPRSKPTVVASGKENAPPSLSSKSKAPRPENSAALHVKKENGKSRVVPKRERKPLVPWPIVLATEARAKEREGFERMIREKEQLREEQRRLEQETEVERLRRELDKKARENVHEVPEWIRKRAAKLKR